MGLNISRELTRLLGGEIKLESKVGVGSTFTLYLPLTYVPPKRPAGTTRNGMGGMQRTAELRSPSRTGLHGPFTQPSMTAPPRIPDPDEQNIEDDRENILKGDRVLLIVEDDAPFAEMLLDIAHQRGFKAVVTHLAERALSYVHRYPIVGVMLDLRLPDHDGYMVLDQLKHDPKTRHIPVHILSVDEDHGRSLKLGAIAHLQKPTDKQSLESAFERIEDYIQQPIRRLLIVEDDQVQRNALVDLIGDVDVEIVAVGTAMEALDALEGKRFDCMVLDLRLPDIDGFGLMERIKGRGGLDIPIIVYTGKDLTRREETELRRFAETIVVKGVRSPERLLDETALFLHRIEANLPAQKRKLLADLRKTDPVLEGRKVLIIDDDVRNIYALTSALERYGMKAVYAENGRDGIALLKNTPDVDAVLMDVMMPEMDGLEATRQIRAIPKFRRIPIVALTAKAMKGDREKCIEAGCSDYIAKPVDTDQLLSLLRVWLYQ